jgi:hypothetical protein
MIPSKPYEGTRFCIDCCLRVVALSRCSFTGDVHGPARGPSAAGGTCSPGYAGHQWIPGGTKGREHCGVCHEPRTPALQDCRSGENATPTPPKAPVQ